ncbi:MAG: AMIN domain-containing protein [Spirulinaceae cyanobacterium]
MVDLRQCWIAVVQNNSQHLWQGALLSAVAPFIAVLPAIAQNNWQFDPNTAQLEMVLDTAITPSYYLNLSPPRIIINLPNSDLSATEMPQTYPGAVQSIQVFTSNQDAQLVLNLDPSVILAPQQIQLQRFETNTGDYRWVLQPSIAQVEISSPPPPPPTPSVTPPTQPSIPVIQFGQPLPSSSRRPTP